MKKLILSLILILVCSFSYVSCEKFDYYDENATSIMEHKNYERAFINTFGEPASDQNWGFPIKLVTRSAMPNSNEWGTNNGVGYVNYPKPADITPEEREAVLAVFNQKGEKSYISILDIDSFFVQQVYCGPNGDKMNELATTVDYKRELVTESWWPLVQYVSETLCPPYDDIINNFNAGKYNGNAEQGCMLMYNSATKDFSFKTSQSGGQRWYNHWRMEKINGNYYVGFDHEAVRQAEANDNEEDLRDYIYNDWIIKIVPGIGFTPPAGNHYRVIGEDLCASESSDFDFNDIVLDVDIIGGNAYCTLVAAGGTLPLRLNKDDNLEVHKLFKVNTNIMVNTGKGPIVRKADLPTFTLLGVTDPNDIEVEVQKNGAWCKLKAETGIPASKLCVDQSFIYCDEYEPMFTMSKDGTVGGRYKAFKAWIHDKTVSWYIVGNKPYYFAE